eukprot:5451907-Pleurochrysis_carterae.AAC.1
MHAPPLLVRTRTRAHSRMRAHPATPVNVPLVRLSRAGTLPAEMLRTAAANRRSGAPSTRRRLPQNCQPLIETLFPLARCLCLSGASERARRRGIASNLVKSEHRIDLVPLLRPCQSELRDFATQIGRTAMAH